MRIVLFSSLMLLLSSCASIKLSPKGCDSSGTWGQADIETHMQDVTKLNKKTIEINTDKTYFVISNYNINIQDILKEYGYSCYEVRNFRVVVTSKFFFYKKIILKFNLE